MSDDKPKFRHAKADTLARFFNIKLGAPQNDEALSELEELARETQDKEAAEQFRTWTHEGTGIWWDARLNELKARVPLYIALAVIALLSTALYYLTRARA